MKIRAVITIDIEALDYVDAADHQRQTGVLLDHLRTFYPSASLTFKERRVVGRVVRQKIADSSSSARQSTGRLSTYVE